MPHTNPAQLWENTRNTVKKIREQTARVIVGQDDVVELMLTALLCKGHCLIVGVPGLAKTLLVSTLGKILGLKFHRIQFTPDLMPTDIVGSEILQTSASGRGFEFAPGPIFANLILADEINRTPPKTQAALLEAMQERQVTADGATHRLPRPFLVVATENPVESEGTYPLPEAQLDRFLLRARLGYPAHDDEVELLRRRIDRRTDTVPIGPVTDPNGFVTIQQAVEHVHVHPALVAYMVDLVTATRDEPELEVGASPRGSLALLKLSRARALLAGRDFVTPDDVRAIALPALSHRVVLTSEAWARRLPPEEVVQRALDTVSTPSWH